MRSLFRSFACLALLLAALCAHPESVKTLPAPTGYIDDYANVLTPSTHDELESVCRTIHDKTRAQIFLVTVHNLGGASRDDFANDLFHTWKIGENKTDRGVLILLAIDDHQRRIEVGYGFEGILPDAKAGDIGREMVPALKAANYDEAARIAVDDVAEIVAEDAHISLAPPQAAAPVVVPTPVVPNDDSSGLIVLIVVVLVAVFFLFLLFQRKRNSSTYYTDTYIPDSQPYNSEPVVPTLFTTPPMPDTTQSSSGWSGLFSGGSSDSGGGSFTGGDGGDSGGGGAGGDW